MRSSVSCASDPRCLHPRKWQLLGPSSRALVGVPLHHPSSARQLPGPALEGSTFTQVVMVIPKVNPSHQIPPFSLSPDVLGLEIFLRLQQGADKERVPLYNRYNTPSSQERGVWQAAVFGRSSSAAPGERSTWKLETCDNTDTPAEHRTGRPSRARDSLLI